MFEWFEANSNPNKKKAFFLTQKNFGKQNNEGNYPKYLWGMQ